MSEIVNVDFVTKVVEVQVNDTETESLAALAAINSAKRAEEISGQFIDDANVIFNGIKAQYGYPFVASTVSAMTDTTKIYVYTGSESGYTAGNWYYNNGTAWVSGGVFNSDSAPLKAEMSLFGVDDLLWDNTNPSPTGGNGITITIDKTNKKVTLAGTSTAPVVQNFYYNLSTMPPWLQKGKTYIAHCDTDADVNFEIREKLPSSTSSVLITSTRSHASFKVSDDATGMIIRLYISAGKTVNTTVRPFISEAPSLGELNVAVNNSMNLKEISNHTDLNDIKDTRCAFLSFGGSDSYINNPLEGKTAGIFRSYVVSSTGFVYQIVNEAYGDLEYSRRYNSKLNKWSDWVINNSSSKAEMSLFGVDDLLWKSTPFDWVDSVISAGVTYTPDVINKCVAVSGTSTGTSFYRFFYSVSAFPQGMVAGGTYIAHLDTDADVTFTIYYYKNNQAGGTPLVYNRKGIFQFTIPIEATGMLIRIGVESGDTVNAVVRPFISEAKSLDELTKECTKNKRSLKYLAVGNSGTQDMLSYVPFIMKNVAPDLDITIGITYASGARIDQQIDFFDNDDPSLQLNLYRAGEDKWVTYSGKTLKECLIYEDWDIISVQQASTYQMQWSYYTQIPDLINRIVTYVGTDHDNYVGHPVKVGYLAPQVRLASNTPDAQGKYQVIETPTTYSDYMDCVQRALDEYPLEFAIVSGTAVQTARKETTLDQYGNAQFSDGTSGHMNADYTHLQEGIGCMVASYASTLFLLDLAGINNRSIMGEGTRPDATWLTEHNIPGQNYGTGVVGISDANCLIAQKCAIMAHKKPFEVSTII